MSNIVYNPDRYNASANYARAMGEVSEGIVRGGNASNVPQGVRAKIARKTSVASDLRAGLFWGFVVFCLASAVLVLVA